MNQKRCFGCMNVKTGSPVCEHCGHDERTNNGSNQLSVGTVLNEQYIVGRALGQGGFGITYLCWDRKNQIPVVIKEFYPAMYVLRKNNGSVTFSAFHDKHGERFYRNRERFVQEAKLLAGLSNVPELVRVYNCFAANNTAYLVMEYVRGTSLQTYVQEQGGTLQVNQLLSLMEPVMRALSRAHEAGLIHRNLSPASVILLPNGGIKIVDFVTIRYSEDGTDPRRAQTLPEPMLRGGYAALEQYRVGTKLTPSADIYALCAMMFTILTGEGLMSATERMANNYTLRLDTVPGLYPAKQEILLQGLHLQPEERPESVSDLYQVLMQPDPVEPEPVQPEEAPAPKHRWLPIALVAAVVLIAVGIFLFVNREDAYLVSEDKPNFEDVEISASDRWVGNVMMPDPASNPDDPARSAVFGSSVAREQVVKVTFLSNVEFANDSAWDISQDGSGRVMAWMEETDGGVHLYIGAKGGVNASAACEGLFRGYSSLKSVDFGGSFYTEGAESMAEMFDGCSGLRSLDLSCLRTNAVTDMSAMFRGCSQLTELNLEGFDTSAVTSFREMFRDCSEFAKIDTAHIATGRATDLSGMFYGCSGLNELSVSHFDTSRVVDMSELFLGCSRLQALDVSGFVTSRATDLSGMFEGCAAVSSLAVNAFDTAKVNDMSRMFYGCSSIQQLDLSSFDTGKVTTMRSMFNNCSGLTELDLRSFNTANVTNMQFLFDGCTGLIGLNIDGLDTSRVTNMSCMFRGCTGLTELDLRHFLTEKVQDMSYMFYGCSALAEVDVSSFNTSKVNNMAAMFCDCTSLAALDLRSFNTYNVTDMSWMLHGCNSLKRLKIDQWNTTNVTAWDHFMNEGGRVKGAAWEKLFR